MDTKVTYRFKSSNIKAFKSQATTNQGTSFIHHIKWIITYILHHEIQSHTLLQTPRYWVFSYNHQPHYLANHLYITAFSTYCISFSINHLHLQASYTALPKVQLLHHAIHKPPPPLHSHFTNHPPHSINNQPSSLHYPLHLFMPYIICYSLKTISYLLAIRYLLLPHSTTLKTTRPQHRPYFQLNTHTQGS